MQSFLSDKNGLSKEDFEKILLGLLLTAVVTITLVVYLKSHIIDTNMVYLTSIIGSLFVIRKGLSYFKPEYYGNTIPNNQSKG